MKKHAFTLLVLAFTLAFVLVSCNAMVKVEDTTANTTVIECIPDPIAETTAETTVETTVETTTAATTTAATTTAATTTADTTVATTAKPKPKYSAFANSVLEGEYMYGGEAVIENIDGITYVNGILIANKSYALPEEYNPGGIHSDAMAAFEEMKAAAAAEGLKLKIVSGYRSYRDQINAYTKFSNRDGKEEADRYSARPGHSEHQTGFSMDVNSVKNSFANTPEGIWLAANCAKYGFIIRYPEGKEHLTGYMYEPWHIRYLGKELAATVTESGLCLEEFLNITSVYAE